MTAGAGEPARPAGNAPLPSPSPSPSRVPSRWAVALAGMLALATAMGIGRFAFTPLLPMMLHDGVTDLPTASWLASANYLGYLVGAVLCTLQPWVWRKLQAGRPPGASPWPAPDPQRVVLSGLLATVVLTAAMALPVAPAWPLLRFASGVASALVFVYSSGWCLAQLARRGVPSMGSLIFVGPGLGIVVSGVFASVMVAWGWTAQAGWLVFAVLAAAFTAWLLPTLRAPELAPAAAASGGAAVAMRDLPTGRGEIALLAFAYGLAGFGYIVTATFLPVIARQSIPGSMWLDLFWPIFGGGVMLGAIVASRIPARDNRVMLVGCFSIQAVGIGVGLASPSAAGFAAGSLLLGLPFTAITFFAMQEVRRLRPTSVPSYTGLLTALYGIGQIVGPPLVAMLLRTTGSASAGFDRALALAGGSLVLGAVLFAALAALYPVGRR